jgi:hypothetical protein
MELAARRLRTIQDTVEAWLKQDRGNLVAQYAILDDRGVIDALPNHETVEGDAGNRDSEGFVVVARFAFHPIRSCPNATR